MLGCVLLLGTVGRTDADAVLIAVGVAAVALAGLGYPSMSCFLNFRECCDAKSISFNERGKTYEYLI